MSVRIEVSHPDGSIEVCEYHNGEQMFDDDVGETFEGELTTAVARVARAMGSLARVETEYHVDAARVLEGARSTLDPTDHKAHRKLDDALTVLDPEGLRHA